MQIESDSRARSARKAAEDIQHNLPDRISREPAIAGQLLEGLIPANDLILLVRGNQVEKRLHRDSALGDGPGQAAHRRGSRPGRDRAGAVQPPHVFGQVSEQFRALGRSQVAGIVHGAGVGVDGEQVPPVPLREKPQRDGEVFLSHLPGGARS